MLLHACLVSRRKARHAPASASTFPHHYFYSLHTGRPAETFYDASLPSSLSPTACFFPSFRRHFTLAGASTSRADISTFVELDADLPDYSHYRAMLAGRCSRPSLRRHEGCFISCRHRTLPVASHAGLLLITTPRLPAAIAHCILVTRSTASRTPQRYGRR